MLVFRCPGKDPLSEVAKTARDDSQIGPLQESLAAFWLDQLQDLDETCLIAATRDLCGSPGQWSPSVGDIRQRAVELSMGHLAPPPPGEAWERVVEWTKGEPIQLSDDEKTALKRCGGKWELQHSGNAQTTRAHFLKFYDELLKKRVMTKRAHPHTKQVAESNTPALPPAKPRAPKGVEQCLSCDKWFPPSALYNGVCYNCQPPGHLSPGSKEYQERVSSLLDLVPGYREQYPDRADR